MIGYVYSDGGRDEAGYKGSARDCVARALSILLTRGNPSADSYKRAYEALAQANVRIGNNRSARNGIARFLLPDVFRSFGIVTVKIPRGTRPTYTEAYERYGDCLVSTTKHVCTIIDGQLMDTFDGRTYEWDDGYEKTIKERKAMKVWYMTNDAGNPVNLVNMSKLQRRKKRIFSPKGILKVRPGK